MIQNSIDLQLTPGGIMPRVHVSQHESGSRTLVFRLWDGKSEYSIPPGCMATLYGRRPDGAGFSTPCDGSGGVLSASVTADMTQCAGRTECEIELVFGQTRVSTENFLLLVEQAS